MAQTPSFPEIIGRAIPALSILDIGAMMEGQERYHALVASGLATVTGCEPNPQQFAKLQGRPGPYRYLPVFLGGGGPATFNLTAYPGCSSLLEPDPAVINLFATIGTEDAKDNFHVWQSAPVETVWLDDLGPEVAPDYIKIDVQGAELDIFRHGTKKLAGVLAIEAEVEFLAMYKDQPLFGDMQVFLRDQGFVLHKLIDVAGRPFRPIAPPNPYTPMSQLLWADAIFVRDFTRIETYGDDDLLKTAALMDMVYHSYDFAAFLLREFDRRQKTELFTRYLQALQGRPLALQVLNIKQQP
jgi:FkbM family methyltransferase